VCGKGKISKSSFQQTAFLIQKTLYHKNWLDNLLEKRTHFWYHIVKSLEAGNGRSSHFSSPCGLGLIS
jgi:hypothetical protein